MGFLAAIPLIGKVFGIIDQLVPDKDEAQRLKHAMELEMLNADAKLLEKEIEARAQALVGEIKGDSWLQRNWRPILMLTIVAIVANNYLLFPYLSLFTDKTVILELPSHLWQLMSIGVGGYVVGRTAEKIVPQLKGRGLRTE